MVTNTVYNSELTSHFPQYQEQKDIEEKCTSQLRVDEQRRTELYAKQGAT